VSVRERLTIDDLAFLPEPRDDTRYELIDGELYVSAQPAWEHQYTCLAIGGALHAWDRQTGAGVTLGAPGVIFAPEDAVAPDVVWVSRERFRQVVGEDHKLHAAPDLMVEVLSPGRQNEERDRSRKLDQYSRYGVQEYWLADWRQRTVQVFRREEAQLRLVATLMVQDTLISPLLPGFSVAVAELFPTPP
jgi:Uma2 family endonuclease